MLDAMLPPPAPSVAPATPAATLYRGPDGMLRYRTDAELADQRVHQARDE